MWPCTQLHAYGTLHPLHSTPARAKLPQPRKHHVRATHAGGGPKSRAPAPNGVPTAFCNFLDFFRHSAPPRTAAPGALFFNNLGMNLSELERPSPSPEKSSLARYRARRQIVLPPRGSPAFLRPASCAVHIARRARARAELTSFQVAAAACHGL